MSSSEFTFAWETASGPSGPFSHLRVVAFTGREAISELFRYEIHLYAREPESIVDPEELLGCRATLRIATLTEPPLRHVHGLVVEAEEIGEAAGGVLYRVVLMPPWARATLRTRSRIFLEKTTRQILENVLLQDPEMAPSDGASVDMGEDVGTPSRHAGPGRPPGEPERRARLARRRRLRPFTAPARPSSLCAPGRSLTHACYRRASRRKVRQDAAMPGRRPTLPLLTACAAVLASAPVIAAAQPPPGQYGPYPQQPAPGPYAQPLPYAPQSYPAGYQPLPNNADDTYTLGRARSWPVLRVSAGAGAYLAEYGELWPSFVLDVNAGYRWAFHSRALLVFEGGYSFDSEPFGGGHFGTAGAGPELFVNRYLSVGWMPRLVVGETWRGFGIGVRNSLTVPLAFRVLQVEVGHQYLRVDGRADQHELRATLGVDFAALTYLYIRRKVGG